MIMSKQFLVAIALLAVSAISSAQSVYPGQQYVAGFRMDDFH